MHWTSKIANSLTKNNRSTSNSYIQKICTIAIALSVCTMLMSSFIINGFDQKIKSKVFDFWSHIRIVPFVLSNSNILETPIKVNTKDIEALKKDPRVLYVQKVANKGAILMKNENIEGVILRGIDLKLLYIKFGQNLQNKTSNRVIQQNEIPLIISKFTADKLNVKINEKLTISFIDNINSSRIGIVTNVFNTNIEEFDEKIVLTDLKKVQEINQWAEDSVSSIEIVLKDISKIQEYSRYLYSKIHNVNVVTIQEIFPQIFDWLKLMAQNEFIIIIVMLIVSMINIISTISILILERTRMIGILKVLGAQHKDLNRLFFIQSFRIISKGIFWGNILALILAYLLNHYKLISLDEKAYYISYAPILIDWIKLIIINIISLIVCALTIFVPLYFISKISPIKVAEYN